jgi:hypothetical protein
MQSVNDKPHRVTWKAGTIVVHTSNYKSAIDVALEYLRQPDTDRMLVEAVEIPLVKTSDKEKRK